MERLRTFHVEVGTSYDVFCQRLFPLLDEIMAAEKTTFRVDTSFVRDRAREHISFQYPTQLHSVFPKQLASIALPFESVERLKHELRLSLPCKVEAKPPSTSTAMNPGPQPTSADPKPPGDGNKKTPLGVTAGQSAK